MAYTIPGGSTYTPDYYLFNSKLKVKMHLPQRYWEKVMPDAGVQFKISDAFPSHRISNKYYLRYLMGQLAGYSSEKELATDIEKICNWCGDHDIILVHNGKDLENVILTATFMKWEKAGAFHHYMDKYIRRPWKDLMLKWRLYRLAHKHRGKRSAKRSQWVEHHWDGIDNEGNKVGPGG